jgi:sulfate transport system ATP-binding protein
LEKIAVVWEKPASGARMEGPSVGLDRQDAPGLSVEHVVKTFRHEPVLRGITLAVREGELLALLGPSGCGKTTLLRILAGLDFPDPGQGRIYFGGRDVTHLTAYERKAGFVFQQYALFEHMTVFDNVAFGLKVLPGRERPKRRELVERVFGLLRLVQLEEFAQRYPGELSGGQKQRVALARALAVNPKVLLLDEPFGALDAKVRKELRRWLRAFHDRTGITSLFVTHDQEEALEIADRVAILCRGEIRQVGSPEEVYHHPADDFVYQFLGDVYPIQHPEEGDGLGGPQGWVRADEIRIYREPVSPWSLPAAVEHFRWVGPVVKVGLRPRVSEGEYLEAHLCREEFLSLGLEVGEEVYLEFRVVKLPHS